MSEQSILLRLIRTEVARQLNVILTGVAGATTTHTEEISEMFPGGPNIGPRPIMQPFGVASRAPSGTLSVVGRQGEHAGNRIVLGHRDADKPEVEAGESALYNAHGQQIYLKNGEIHIGTPEAANPVVLGDVLRDMLSSFLASVSSHKHIDSIGGITMPPTNAGDFDALQSSPVDDNAILSDHIFVTKAPGGA